MPTTARLDPELAALLRDPQAIRLEQARRRLGVFCEAVTPGYVRGQHINQLTAKLEAVERGELKRLMVFMPPRYSKSYHVSQKFPCWYLGRNPARRVVLASYSQPIALEQSRRARDTFVGERCRDVFPYVLHRPGRSTQEPVAVERQAAQEWGTNQGGGYFAIGIGGGLTGRGFDLGIIDDPVKDREEADSPVIREKVWQWYQSTFYTRAMPGASIVLCQTRWHPDDLAGRLLEESRRGKGDPWDVLELAAIDREGRPLWPEFWPLEELEKIKIAVGPREWAALYQQTPSVAGGAIFKRDWWNHRRYDPADRSRGNACVARAISWDTAEKTEEGNAYSACSVGELSPAYQMDLREVVRDRWEFPELCRQIEGVAARHNRDEKLTAVLIEDKSSGTAAIQSLMTLGPDWLKRLIVSVNPKGDKIQRAYAASAWCTDSAGVVWLPAPSDACPWLFTFEEELFSFPASVYKDQVDSFTQLIWYWTHFLAAGLGVSGYA